jgi:hypothetical protein
MKKGTSNVLDIRVKWLNLLGECELAIWIAILQLLLAFALVWKYFGPE